MGASIGLFYRWLYYRCYRYSEKTGNSGFFIHWASASIYLLMILMMNMFVLLFLLIFVAPGTFAVLFMPRSWIIGAVAVGVVLLQFSLLGHKARYKKILSEFSRESVEQQRRGDLLFGWYLVLSLFSLIAMFVVAAVRAGFSS